MPPLDKPAQHREIDLPPRRARLAAETDVLVVGGGPSGLGAALGAAWAGATVVLAERWGFMGGTATAALVTLWVSWRTQSEPPPGSNADAGVPLFPTDHGPGRPVSAGAVTRLVNSLTAAGAALAPSPETGYTMPFDPEAFKLAAMDLLDEAGVRFLFHALASGVLPGPAGPEGVVFETKSGPLAIRAKNIVDCTGDGDVAAWAGAPFAQGRPEDGLTQPMTLMFRLAGFQREAFAAYARAHPDQWRGVHGLWDLVRQAAQDGELELPREDILFFGTERPGELLINSTRIIKALGTDVFDLTRAEWEGRRQMRQLTAFFKRYAPGFEQVHVSQSGAAAGVRESRRILGEHVLTADDVLACRTFPDVIARGAYPMDVHNPTGKGTRLTKLPPGAAYDIPLRCLLPQGVERLLVAGRCLSGAHEAHSSYRVMPTAMATGQAAGVCAALAARSGRPPRRVPAAEVQAELAKQGAGLE